MMSTSFLQAVLHYYPTAHVDLIVKAGLEALPLPHRGEVLVFDRQQNSPGKFGASLRSRRYDRFYILPPSFSSAWMAFRSGAVERIGYGGNARSWLLKPARQYSHVPRTQHLISEYLGLLEETLSPREFPPYLPITEEWIEGQLSAISPALPKSFVAIAAGAIYGPAKQWPTEHYQTLVKQLVQAGHSIVIVGTAADRKAGDQILNGETGVENRCGQTNLPQLVALLARASLLISNDSGSMHMMAGLQRPQVAVFGSTSPVWTGPLNGKATVMYKQLECSPCFQRTCRFGHYNCLRNINPDEVKAAALKALAGSLGDG